MKMMTSRCPVSESLIKFAFLTSLSITVAAESEHVQAAQTVPAASSLQVDDEEDVPDEAGTKVLSKKEKEKLKKDREKAGFCLFFSITFTEEAEITPRQRKRHKPRQRRLLRYHHLLLLKLQIQSLRHRNRRMRRMVTMTKPRVKLIRKRRRRRKPRRMMNLSRLSPLQRRKREGSVR